ncbi:MAG: spore coat protein CotJB [Lachnospiraceae bacterium]|nr:spore coat protein CotJB [Lachnospiraceae bacterium]
MKETHLAIASVPCQQWGPLYDDGKALRQGTIFQELDLPFYVTEGIPEGQCAQKENSSQLLCQIQQISFVLDDLTLYLDMHGEDGQALAMYQEKLAVRDQLKKEFAQKFYPLTRDCVAYCQGQAGVHGDHAFCWQDGPMPWEGV